MSNTSGNINNRHCLFLLTHSYVVKQAIVLLVALTWNNLAFCGEIHDAAEMETWER